MSGLWKCAETIQRTDTGCERVCVCVFVIGGWWRNKTMTETRTVNRLRLDDMNSIFKMVRKKRTLYTPTLHSDLQKHTEPMNLLASDLSFCTSSCSSLLALKCFPLVKVTWYRPLFKKNLLWRGSKRSELGLKCNATRQSAIDWLRVKSLVAFIWPTICKNSLQRLSISGVFKTDWAERSP